MFHAILQFALCIFQSPPMRTYSAPMLPGLSRDLLVAFGLSIALFLIVGANTER